MAFKGTPHNKRHGLTNTLIYARWRAMLQRCTNPNNKSWPNYGGRGIFVCNRWKVFDNFYADMGDPAPNETIERIDNDGPYSPENCRWATRKAQVRNTRKTVLLEVNGITRPLADWADDLGLSANVLRDRLDRGWGVEQVVTTPRCSDGQGSSWLRKLVKAPVKDVCPHGHSNFHIRSNGVRECVDCKNARNCERAQKASVGHV